LAAASLARIEVGRLRQSARSGSVETRRAAAYGAGFAPPERTTATRILDQALGDSDPLVRFLACQSLARLQGAGALEKLSHIAFDTTQRVADRAAALTAVADINTTQARRAVLLACDDK
jgi:hypothetical protein